MAERVMEPRLQAVYDTYKHVYSYSKLNSINQCEYDSYLSYIKKDRGIDSIYSILGGKIHDALQKIMDGDAGTECLNEALQEELDDLDMFGLDFPKDFRGGNSIREKWIANMKHFCNDFKPLDGKFKTEELVVYKIDDERAIIGYADFIKFNDDGTVSIGDWKTSSWFATKDLVEHGRQFVIYQMALEQLGYKVKSTFWVMLKYAHLEWDSYTKTGKVKHNIKDVDRCKIGSTIYSDVVNAMHELGYDDLDVDRYADKLVETNDVSCLPDEIASKFKVSLCCREYPVTEKLKQECRDYINKTVTRFEKLEENIETPWNAVEINKQNSFFCANLCGHRKTCPKLKDYFNKLSTSSSDDDLF